MSCGSVILVTLLLISSVEGIGYELYYVTSDAKHSESFSGVNVRLIGDYDLKTDPVNLIGRGEVGQIDTMHMYEWDVGVPTDVWIQVRGNDGWRVAQFRVRKDGEDTWYTTEVLNYELDDWAEKTFPLRPAKKYQLTTITSRSEWAQTDDDLLFTLHGSKGNTRPRILDNDDKNDFEEGETDVFVFYDTDIGYLDCIEVELKGGNGWKVDKIEVEIGQAQRVYTTRSLETWLDDHSSKKFCDLLVEDACDCKTSITGDSWELTGVMYDTKGSDVSAVRPDQVASQTVSNSGGSADQSSEFTVEETVQETASFTHTYGTSITYGTSFTAGIPDLVEGTVSTEISASAEFSFGSETTVSKTLSSTFTCVAPPHHDVTCKAFVQKYNVQVPYTQTWTHKVHKCDCESGGVFNEVGATDMVLKIDGKVQEDAGKTSSSGGFGTK